MPQRSLKHIIIIVIVAFLIFIGGIAINQVAYAIAVDLIFIIFMLILIDILTTLEEIRDNLKLKNYDNIKEQDENIKNFEVENDKDLENIINSYQNKK